MPVCRNLAPHLALSGLRRDLGGAGLHEAPVLAGMAPAVVGQRGVTTAVGALGMCNAALRILVFAPAGFHRLRPLAWGRTRQPGGRVVRADGDIADRPGAEESPGSTGQGGC